MIITCPNCQTRYQVADQAIGSAGRKVMCANCHQAWKAVATLPEEPAPKPQIVAGTDIEKKDLAPGDRTDKLFGQDSEAALDKAFEREERRFEDDEDETDESPVPNRASAPADEGDEDHDEDDETEDALDHSLLSRRAKDLARRQRKHASRLPLARVRRFLRMTALVLFMTLIGMGYWFRVDLVRAYPDLGALYASIGLPVNIYGLTFSEVETLRTLKDGDDVTIITANIRSVIDHTVRVPPVLVSILNDQGDPIYEWTARAPIDNISPGDIVQFETQLSSAPTDAAHVRLVFGSNTGSQKTEAAEEDNSGGR